MVKEIPWELTESISFLEIGTSWKQMLSLNKKIHLLHWLFTYTVYDISLLWKLWTPIV